MQPKEVAAQFLKLASSGRVEEAYSRFVAKDFLHHNQYFPGDRESLKQGMTEASEGSPNEVFEIKKLYADGDTVVAHSYLRKSVPEGLEVAVVHIFRFQNNQIVEMWDVGQIIDPHSPNSNGMF